jgi:hypothetical protein
VRKHRLTALGLLLVAVTIAVALLVSGHPKTPFRANYNRVRGGMTPDEVHALLDMSLKGIAPQTFEILRAGLLKK